MDLDVAWLMAPADTMPADEFEEWYVGRHTEVAKRLPGLRRYVLSRLLEEGLLEAPDGLGDVYRVAQLVWSDPGAAEAAFVSYDGMASFGDNLLATGSSSYTKGVGLTLDRGLDVLRPAAFDPVTGCFRRTVPGQDGRPRHVLERGIVKVLAYGFDADPGSAAEVWADVCGDQRVRGVVVGSGLGRPLDLGRVAVPGPGVGAARWSVEWWFDTEVDARAVLASPSYAAAWSACSEGNDEVFRGIFTSREVFASRPA